MGKLNTVQNGKGSKPRTSLSGVSDERWNKIFAKQKEEKTSEETRQEETKKTTVGWADIYRI